MILPRLRHINALRMASRYCLPGVKLADHISRGDLEFAIATLGPIHGQLVYSVGLTGRRLTVIAGDTTGEFSAFMRDLVRLLGDIARRKSGLDYIWAPGRPVEIESASPHSRDDVLDLFCEFRLAAIIDGTTTDLNTDHIVFGLKECFARTRKRRVPRPSSLGRRTRWPADSSFSVRKPKALRGRSRRPVERRLRRLVRRRLGDALRMHAIARKRVRPPYGNGGTTYVGNTAPVRERAYEDWRVFYDQCRERFRTDRDVVFPAGVVRFHDLGAWCDPRTPI